MGPFKSKLSCCDIQILMHDKMKIYHELTTTILLICNFVVQFSQNFKNRIIMYSSGSCTIIIIIVNQSA